MSISFLLSSHGYFAHSFKIGFMFPLAVLHVDRITKLCIAANFTCWKPTNCAESTKTGPVAFSGEQRGNHSKNRLGNWNYHEHR